MAEAFAFSHAWEQPGVAARLLRRWGHHAALLLQVSVVVTVALGFRTAAPTLGTLMLMVLFVVFVLITFGLMRQHDRRLCEDCAAAIPLNAAERGARYRRRFAVAHASGEPKLLASYLVVLFGSNALLMLPAGRWPWALVQLSMVYLIAAHVTHRRLQPWCPRCSGGGGGDEVDDDVPDLPRGRGRQLV